MQIYRFSARFFRYLRSSRWWEQYISDGARMRILIRRIRSLLYEAQSPETLTALYQSWGDIGLHLHIGAIAPLVRKAILDLLHLARIGIGIELGLPDDKAHRCLRHLCRANEPRGRTDTVDDLLTGISRRRIALRSLRVTFKTHNRQYICPWYEILATRRLAWRMTIPLAEKDSRSWTI